MCSASGTLGSLRPCYAEKLLLDGFNGKDVKFNIIYSHLTAFFFSFFVVTDLVLLVLLRFFLVHSKNCFQKKTFRNVKEKCIVTNRRT